MTDNQISDTLRDITTWARDELGFQETPLRGDGLLELTSGEGGSRRVTYETRFIHGEGRVVLRRIEGTSLMAAARAHQVAWLVHGPQDMAKVCAEIKRRVTRWVP